MITWPTWTDPHAIARVVGEGVPADWPALAVGEVLRTRPDWHGQARTATAALARASLWWSHDIPPWPDPAVPEARMGVIGHFGAADAEVAAELLARCCARLQAQGCTHAVGPMDGHVWEKYRFTVESNGEPPFLFEYQHPAAWPDWWQAAGFTPLAYYGSGLTTRLDEVPPSVVRLEQRLAQRQGVRLRRFDASDPDADLRRIHAMSARSFKDNFLNIQVTWPYFRLQCEPMLPLVDPDLFWLAECPDGSLCGYIFCLPDYVQQQREGRIDTLVIKTLGALHERRYQGVGVVLTKRAQLEAHRKGYRRAIHALMHEGAMSTAMSARRHDSTPFRRYALFSRSLA